MSSLRSLGSKLGKAVGISALYAIEITVATVCSIAAFGSLFWFGEWWKGLLAVGGFFAITVIVFAICGYARGER